MEVFLTFINNWRLIQDLRITGGNLSILRINACHFKDFGITENHTNILACDKWKSFQQLYRSYQHFRDNWKVSQHFRDK